MKASELRELNLKELQAKSSSLRAELFNVKVKQATGQLEDTAKLGSLRRDVARVETVLRQKQAGSE